jgi:hypothetical protein
MGTGEDSLMNLLTGACAFDLLGVREVGMMWSKIWEGMVGLASSAASINLAGVSFHEPKTATERVRFTAEELFYPTSEMTSNPFAVDRQNIANDMVSIGDDFRGAIAKLDIDEIE